MQKEESFNRQFKGGSWDLRKDERRLKFELIGFPDRRNDERRLTKMHNFYAPRLANVDWVNKPTLDK